MRVDELSSRLSAAASRRVHTRGERLGSVLGRLDALSPLAVLHRGYAIAQTDDGEVVRRGDELAVGQGLRLRLGSGGAWVRVEEVDEA